MPRTSENQHVSDEEIARLYLSCKSLKKVAALMKRPTSYVWKALHKLGVPINKRGAPKGTILSGKLTIKQREELRADLRTDKFSSLATIGKKYGVSREYVRQVANKEGIFTYSRIHGTPRGVRPPRNLSPERAALVAAQREALRPRITELWNAGVAVSDIAKELGLETAALIGSYLRYLRYHFPEDFPIRYKTHHPEPKYRVRMVNEGGSLTARLSRIVAAARRKKAEAERMKNVTGEAGTDSRPAEK